MIDGRTIAQIARDDNADACRAGRLRAMDTSLGRWTRTDPLGYVDGANAFEYVGSSPASALDPKGLRRVCATAAANPVDRVNPDCINQVVQEGGIKPPPAGWDPSDPSYDDWRHCWVGCELSHRCFLSSGVIAGYVRETLVDPSWRDIHNTLAGAAGGVALAKTPWWLKWAGSGDCESYCLRLNQAGMTR